MYAILKQDNSIGDFEYRNLPLEELVHDDFKHLYITVSEEDGLKIGDIFDRETGTWTIVPEVKQPIYQERVITNTEIAQMISDLYANLIISGVIE